MSILVIRIISVTKRELLHVVTWPYIDIYLTHLKWGIIKLAHKLVIVMEDIHDHNAVDYLVNQIWYWFKLWQRNLITSHSKLVSFLCTSMVDNQCWSNNVNKEEMGEDFHLWTVFDLVSFWLASVWVLKKYLSKHRRTCSEIWQHLQKPRSSIVGIITTFIMMLYSVDYNYSRILIKTCIYYQVIEKRRAWTSFTN